MCTLRLVSQIDIKWTVIYVLVIEVLCLVLPQSQVKNQEAWVRSV